MDESDVATWPMHADDCALVTSHHLTCTCGATSRAVQEARDRLYQLCTEGVMLAERAEAAERLAGEQP